MSSDTVAPPYDIDKKILKRFDQRQTIFGRMLYDAKAAFYRQGMYEKIEEILSKHKRGYSRIEFAQVMGAWTVYDHFHNAFSWTKLTDANNVMDKPMLKKHPIGNKADMSIEIKKIAKMYGASLVGITRVNRYWIYANNRDGVPIEIPEEFNFAIVMAIRMNHLAIRTSPTFAACAETGIGYSRMAFSIACLSEAIRSLGYKAIPMGNDTALSIPLAIDAGLGELGRNGLLITPEYGPCVRLCKVFTNLPLKTDDPIAFGVKEFCKKCKKCANACKADAIQIKDGQSYKITCPSNNKGILRWAVNHDKCYKFWIENGGDCSNCISVCPFVTQNNQHIEEDR